MKNISILLISFVFFGFVANNEFKYQGRKKFLLAETWKCVKVSSNDTVMFDSVFTKLMFRFFSNHRFVCQYDTLSTNGRWRFNQNQTKIQLLNIDNQKITLKITKLTTTEFKYLILNSSDTNQITELHFEPVNLILIDSDKISKMDADIDDI